MNNRRLRESSEQQLNKYKSLVLPSSKVVTSIKNNMKTSLGITREGKVNNRLGNLLSCGGKEVAQATLTYVISCYLFPKEYMPIIIRCSGEIRVEYDRL